jgi:WD40 repeat protein
MIRTTPQIVSLISLLLAVSLSVEGQAPAKTDLSDKLVIQGVVSGVITSNDMKGRLANYIVVIKKGDIRYECWISLNPPDSLFGKRILGEADLRFLFGKQVRVSLVNINIQSKQTISGTLEQIALLEGSAEVTNEPMLRPMRAIKTPSVVATAISPDGNFLAWAGLSSAGKEPSVQIIDTQTGSVVRTLTGFRGDVTSITFSASGKLMATGDDGVENSHGSNGATDTLKLWSAQTGRLLRTFKGLEGSVDSVAFSPDERIVASSDYAVEGQVKLWNTQTGAFIKKLTNAPGLASGPLAFSPDGRILGALNGNGDAKFWNVLTGVVVRTLPYQWGPFAFSNTGNVIAVGGGGGLDDKHLISFWDARTWKVLRTIPESDGANSIAFFANDRIMATGGAYGVKLWSIQKGTVTMILDSQRDDNVILSRNGKILVSANFYEGTVKLWDVSGLK